MRQVCAIVAFVPTAVYMRMTPEGKTSNVTFATYEKLH
jgi:hypothetical protein